MVSHLEKSNTEQMYELIRYYPLVAIILQFENDLEVNHLSLYLEIFTTESVVLQGYIAKQNPMENGLKMGDVPNDCIAE